ncbi:MULTISPECIES: hypothetical protein [Alphaproteobacteria]|uniref:hypothetical protein n=1 Tax=Alphaproteobacteria TaxID=28211 RepID=UPI003266A733
MTDYLERFDQVIDCFSKVIDDITPSFSVRASVKIGAGVVTAGVSAAQTYEETGALTSKDLLKAGVVVLGAAAAAGIVTLGAVGVGLAATITTASGTAVIVAKVALGGAVGSAIQGIVGTHTLIYGFYSQLDGVFMRKLKRFA